MAFLGAPTMIASPDRGYSSAPQMLSRVDAFGQQMGEQQAMDDLAALDARKALMGTDNLFSTQGRDTRTNALVHGALSPQVENQLREAETPVPQNAYSPVPPPVVAAATALDSIDPMDEKAWESMTSLLQEIGTNPATAGSGIQTHPFFQKSLSQLKDAIMDNRTRQQIQKSTNQRMEEREQRRAMNLKADEVKSLNEAADMLETYGPDQVNAAFRLKHGRDPATPEEMAAAQALVESDLAPYRAALADIVRDLQASGRQVPQRFVEMAQRVSAQQPMAQAEGDVPIINSVAELRAMNLPKGTRFKTASGQPMIVK